MEVHVERLKKLESEVQTDGSSHGHTHSGRVELARTGWLSLLPLLSHGASSLLQGASHIQDGSLPLSFSPTCQSSPETPSQIY